MVLEVRDEGAGRKRRRRLSLAAAFMLHVLALPSEPFSQSAAKQIDPADEIGIIPEAFACHGRVQEVVYIIVPLRGIKTGRPIVATLEPSSLVFRVLRHQMDVAPIGRCTDLFCQVLQHMFGPRIFDRMHRVKAQPVDVKLVEPIAGIGEDEVADHARPLVIEVDRGSPRSCVLLRGKRRVDVHIVPLGPEVVVDHVDEHHEVAGVSFIHQRLEVLGPAVGRIRRKQMHAVVAPVPATGEVGDWH